MLSISIPKLINEIKWYIVLRVDLLHLIGSSNINYKI